MRARPMPGQALMRRCDSVPCLALALLLSATTSSYAQLSLDGCTIAGEAARCGVLRVPEDRQSPPESFVQDLEAARAALGYEQISLYGASYGTRAAFAYARRYPARVRSLVLVGPAPMSMSFLDSFEEDGRTALTAIADDCLSDAGCSKAFPNLSTALDEIRRDLTDSYHVLGQQFLAYSSATARAIPCLVTQAAAGNQEPLDLAIDRFRQQLVGQLSIGLHLTIMCSEDLPFVSRGAADRAPSAARREYMRACQGWPRVDVPAAFHEPSRVERPALIIAGEWDPVTSPRWARAEAEQFSRSQVAIVPKSGHMLSGLDGCIGIVTAEFLDKGKADASCLARNTWPPYVLGPR